MVVREAAYDRVTARRFGDEFFRARIAQVRNLRIDLLLLVGHDSTAKANHSMRESKQKLTRGEKDSPIRVRNPQIFIGHRATGHLRIPGASQR